MELNVLLTGLKVHDYTIEAIRTIHEHNPEVDIIWIDAGEEPSEIEHCRVIHLPGASLAKSFNFAIRENPATWHLIVNDDVVCLGKVDTDKLFGGCLYGPMMAGSPEVGDNPYLEGWAYFLSNHAFHDGVTFDDNITRCEWSDFDITMQARAKGYRIEAMDFPFDHLRLSKRKGCSDSDAWKANLEYVKRKWEV